MLLHFRNCHYFSKVVQRLTKKCMGFEAREIRFEYQKWYFLVVWPWRIEPISLSLNFFTSVLFFRIEQDHGKISHVPYLSQILYFAPLFHGLHYICTFTHAHLHYSESHLPMWSTTSVSLGYKIPIHKCKCLLSLLYTGCRSSDRETGSNSYKVKLPFGQTHSAMFR